MLSNIKKNFWKLPFSFLTDFDLFCEKGKKIVLVLFYFSFFFFFFFFFKDTIRIKKFNLKPKTKSTAWK